jgi:hypothetical protein
MNTEMNVTLAYRRIEELRREAELARLVPPGQRLPRRRRVTLEFRFPVKLHVHSN